MMVIRSKAHEPCINRQLFEEKPAWRFGHPDPIPAPEFRRPEQEETNVRQAYHFDSFFGVPVL